MNRLSFLSIVLLSFILQGWAAEAEVQESGVGRERGALLIRAFKPRDYNGSPVVTRLGLHPQDGTLLAISNTHLHLFDGYDWIRVETETPGLRSLAVDEAGRVWLAGVDQLGYCERGAQGDWVFHGLAGKLPEEHRKLGRIWDTVVLGDSVWFATETKVLRWHQGAFSVWTFSGTGTLLCAGRRLLLQRKNEVLLEWNGATFVELSRDPLVAGVSIMRLINDGQAGHVGMTSAGGFFRLRGGSVEALMPGLRAHLGKARIISACPREGQGWLLGTDSGALLVDQEGRIERRLDKASGLTDSPVMDVLRDAEGAYWLATLSGLYQVEEPEAATIFTEAQGLPEGISQAMVRHEGRLYVSSPTGLLRLDGGEQVGKARFQSVPGSPRYPQKILSTPQGLLVPHSGGLLCFDGAQFRPLIEGGLSVVSLCLSRTNPGLLLLGCSDAVVLCRFSDGRLTELRRLSGLGQIRSIDEDAAGDYWLSTSTRGVHRLRAREGEPSWERPELRTYDTQGGGLKAGRDSILCFQSPGGLVFNALSATLRSSADGEKLVVDDRIRSEGRAVTVVNVLERGEGRVWASVTVEGTQTPPLLGSLGSAGEGELQPVPASLQDRLGGHGANLLLVDPSQAGGAVWVKGLDGLLRLEPERLQPGRGPSRVRLTRLEAEGQAQNLGAQASFKYSRKPILVEFAATSLASGTGLVYQTRLEGWESDWSAWSPERQLRYSGLPAGSYRLDLRARDRLGRVGGTTSFALVIRPPLWLHPYTIFGYIVLGLVLVAGFVRWRLRHAERERLRLEGLVAVRTAELAVARDRAEEASRAKSAFLASMSHELRTPLNGVIGYAQLLDRDTRLESDQRARLRIIQRSGEHLLRMINDVLDLAKIEAGKLELRPAPFRLAELLADLAPAHANAAAVKGLRFGVDLSPAVPGWLQGDAQKLRQLLDNLLGNAVKFTQAGSVRLEAGVSGDGRLCIRVLDTGPGIGHEDQQRLFQPFEQARHSRPQAPGTGLGLALCRAIASRMGGDISLQSKPGEGACFTLSLPLLPCAAPDASVVSASRPRAYLGPRRRILIIDDNEVNRSLLEDLLGGLGFECRSHVSGEAFFKALEQGEKLEAELAIVDVRMEGIDGLETTRRLRSLSKPGAGLRILLSSASVLSFDQEQGKRAGCDDFLPKPFAESVLLEKLGRLLDLVWSEEPKSKGATPVEAVVGCPSLGEELHSSLQDSLEQGDLEALRRKVAALRAESPGNPELQQLEEACRAFDLGRLRVLLRREAKPPALSPSGTP